MAEVLQGDICEHNSCSSLVFRDLTGQYSLNNQTGYNAPNLDITGATAELDITLADGTTYTLPMAGFPTVDKTLEFQINSSDIGYQDGSKIEDQIISFTYRVTYPAPGNEVVEQKIVKGFYCQAKCCVSRMFIDLDIDCADCIKVQCNDRVKATQLLAGLEYTAQWGNKEVFNKTLNQIKKLCKTSDCSNCK